MKFNEGLMKVLYSMVEMQLKKWKRMCVTESKQSKLLMEFGDK